MNYLSSTEASKRLGLSARRVQQMCKSGEIPGAIKLHSTWNIPASAVSNFSGPRKKPLPIGISDYKTASCFIN